MKINAAVHVFLAVRPGAHPKGPSTCSRHLPHLTERHESEKSIDQPQRCLAFTQIPLPTVAPAAAGAMATAATSSSHPAVAWSTALAEPVPPWRRGTPPARCQSQVP